MKITILNGSPKGQHSITLTYLHFLKTRFPRHQYTIIHISKDIRVIENDRERFDEIMETVNSSDAVLWLYGVWVLLVPAQMLRFMELIRERKGAPSHESKKNSYNHSYGHNLLPHLERTRVVHNIRYYKPIRATSLSMSFLWMKKSQRFLLRGFKP